jgi:hypothetical protein
MLSYYALKREKKREKEKKRRDSLSRTSETPLYIFYAFHPTITSDYPEEPLLECGELRSVRACTPSNPSSDQTHPEGVV